MSGDGREELHTNAMEGSRRFDMSRLKLSAVGSSVSSILSSEEVARHFYRCIYIFSWACAGFATGFHWLYLAYAGVGLTSSKHLDTWSCMRHFASYWLASLAVAAGATWTREAGEYRQCPGNVTMSRACLYEVQKAEYRTVYMFTLVALSFAVVHWVLDGIQLLSWDSTLREDKEPVVLWTSIRLFSWGYWAVILATVAVVAVTWSTVVEWNTEDESIGVLAAIVAAEIVVCAGLVFVVARAVAPRSTEAEAKP